MQSVRIILSVLAIVAGFSLATSAPVSATPLIDKPVFSER